MSLSRTKYEDIPPRYRKAWIKGNAEKVQKQLNEPLEAETTEFPHPYPATSASSNRPRTEPWKLNTYSTPNDLEEFLRSSTPSLKRWKADNNSDSDDNLNVASAPSEISRLGRSSAIVISHKSPREASIHRDINEPPTTQPPSGIVSRSAQSGIPSRVISDAPSRSLLQSARPKYHSNPPSRSTTRPNSPVPGPSRWTSLSSRRSLRRFEVRPWGPRHLEYDYSEARKDFQSAAYFALGQYGYVPPKGFSKSIITPTDALPSMAELRKVPQFRRACEKLDETDRALEAALARGETWEDTPVPLHYLQFSLEKLPPEDIRIQRVSSNDNALRSRSSVTLEEEAALVNGEIAGTDTRDEKGKGKDSARVSFSGASTVLDASAENSNVVSIKTEETAVQMEASDISVEREISEKIEQGFASMFPSRLVDDRSRRGSGDTSECLSRSSSLSPPPSGASTPLTEPTPSPAPPDVKKARPSTPQSRPTRLRPRRRVRARV